MGLRMNIERIDKTHFNGTRALVVIHVVLVLLLPFIFTQMGGCQGEDDIKPLALGPEISPKELDTVISEPLSKTDPLTIQLGQFFVYSDTQEIAGGAAKNIIADTAQTVVDRQESSTEVLLTIIQHQQTYQNGEVRKVSTEIPVRIEKAPVAEASSLMIGPVEEIKKSGFEFRPEVMALLNDRYPLALKTGIRTLAANSDSVQATSGDRITYHNLKRTVAMEAPPLLVQKQAGCAGLPNCQIEVYRVSFDMVFWENGKADRVRWDLAMSPSAPYLAAVLDKCVTGLASVGAGQSKILVKQCKPVVNFRYQAP